MANRRRLKVDVRSIDLDAVEEAIFEASADETSEAIRAQGDDPEQVVARAREIIDTAKRQDEQRRGGISKR